MEIDVEFYETADGKEPAKDFLNSLDHKMRAKMVRMITLLEKNGNDLRSPYSKCLIDGIFELRAKFGNDITRVLYFFYIEQRVVLTNGFVKKTQKTPVKEITKARKYRADYIERNKKI